LKAPDLKKELPLRNLNESNADKLRVICNEKVRALEQPLVIWFVLEDIFLGIVTKSGENQLSYEDGDAIFAPLVGPTNEILYLILSEGDESKIYSSLTSLIIEYVKIEKALFH